MPATPMTQQQYDNFIKLITAASVAAAPVIGNLPDDSKMSADAEQTDLGMEAQSLAEFRIIRRFAYLIAGTMGNDAYWPTLPDMAGGAPGSGGSITADALKGVLPALLADKAVIDMVKNAVMGT